MASICAAAGVVHGAPCPTSTPHNMKPNSEAAASARGVFMRHYTYRFTAASLTWEQSASSNHHLNQRLSVPPRCIQRRGRAVCQARLHRAILYENRRLEPPSRNARAAAIPGLALQILASRKMPECAPHQCLDEDA